MADRLEGPFELRLPSDPLHAATARLFVASLARVLGMPDDRIDDLRLAVSEAVSAAILAQPDGEVVVAGRIGDGSLELRVSPVTAGAMSDDRFDVEAIIRSLFDGTFIEGDVIVIPASG